MRILAATLCCMCLLGCGDRVTQSDRDLVELERVWQHMKVFSLYQDRVPSHEQALRFEAPADMVHSIRDTLYTPTRDSTIVISHYYPKDSEWNSCSQNNQQSSISSVRMFSIGPLIVERLTDSTIYVYIETFHDEALVDYMRQIADTIRSVPNLIIDLTGNGGGFLDQCTSAVELILPAGLPYLSTTYRKNMVRSGDSGTVTDIWRTRRDDDGWEGRNLAVVINSGTASAAEIMAVALRDANPKPTSLIGARSFGKGIGQYEYCFNVTSGAQLRLTGFRFLRIVGEQRDYNETGIEPDLVIEEWATSTSQGWRESIRAACEILEPGSGDGISPHTLSELERLVHPRSYSYKTVIPACKVRIDGDGDMLF